MPDTTLGIMIENSDEQSLTLRSEGDSAASPTMQSQPSQIIRLVKFEFCSGQQCPWNSDSRVHLLISNHEADLEKEEEINGATAISYAWGEFERTERLIGHNTNGDNISITIGGEWDTESFTNRLVLLSFEGRGCWIDQLCMPQKESEIRKALASIPTIYRTLDVVVLMPGAPCKCLCEGFEALKVAKEFGNHDDYISVMGSILKDMERCLNFFPNSSWFNRLWTRQELLYSRRISMAWAEIRDTPCVNLGPNFPPGQGEQVADDCYVTAEQALDLAPFARLVYQRAAEENYSALFGSPNITSAVKRAFQTGNLSGLLDVVPGLLVTSVDKACSIQPRNNTAASARLRQTTEEGRRVVENLKKNYAKMSAKVATATLSVVQSNLRRAALTEYIGGSYFENVNEDLHFFEFVQFLAGETIERVGDPDLMSEGNRFGRFFHSLGYLRASVRTSTQVRDYVNAVWVDCPDYQIPVNNKTMDLPALLEDALAQLQANHMISVVTAAPAGLLGSTHGTGLWKPSLYLPKTSIKNSAQIYGTLTRPFKPVSVTRDGTIPLRFTGAGYFALSSKADDYEDQLSRRPTGFMFNRMKGVASLWPPRDILERCRLTPTDEQLAEGWNGWRNLALVGRSFASSVSTAVSSLARIGFGGRSNFYEDREEANRSFQAKTMADLNAQQQDARNKKDFMDLLKTYSLKLMRTHSAPRDNDSYEWGSRGEVNHFEIVYRLVADILGLDYEMCRSRHLRLMIAEDPPCIGLANRNVSISRAGRRAGGTSDYDRIKTIGITPGDGISGHTLYEVEKVEGNFDSPRYRVFGVWVPFVGVCQDRLHAVAEAGATDGYII
jgi:Heterokaryon incompatibility protein (HET)